MKANLLIILSIVLLNTGVPSFAVDRTDTVPVNGEHIGIWMAPVGLVYDRMDDESSDLRVTLSPPMRRLLEPTIFVMAFHTIGMGVLVSMDPAETGFKPMHIRNWADGLTAPPIWDNDSWITNYILHPAWGSETYLRARRAAFNPLESFLFSTAASVVWEYGFESWAEHPSIQDLLVTSTVGSVLGEFRYAARRALLREDAWWASVLLVLVDPLDAIMTQSMRLAGQASRGIDAAARSRVALRPTYSSGPVNGTTGSAGLNLSIIL